MDGSPYLLGVLLAILAGTITNFGTVLQKKVVNQIPTDSKFVRSLIKNPLWLLGLALGLGLGSIFFMTAQVFIGPALVPGLMAAGLIVLAIGSIKIVGETLKRSEFLGIVLMIFAIFLLGLSELSIEIAKVNMLEIAFITRFVVFTVALFLSSVLCELIARNFKKLSGILLAISSGFMFAISNFWISPLMGVIVRVFEGAASWGELIWFISSSIMLPLVNMIGIYRLQAAFKEGQASNLVPIQQIPIQIAPIIVYFFVFLLIAPNLFSIIYMVLGVMFIIVSSFLLGKRKAQMDEIK